MPGRGPAGKARHTGVSIGVWEREGKALGVPPRIAATIRTTTAPLHGAKPLDALRAGQVGQRAFGHEERRARLRVSSKTPRPQEHGHRPCGTERVLQKFPLRLLPLLIVTRMGRDYRPGPRQRIEQVACQGSGENSY
jgi:hypothetical protein